MSLQKITSDRTMQVPVSMGTLHLPLMDTNWDNISRVLQGSCSMIYMTWHCNFSTCPYYLVWWYSQPNIFLFSHILALFDLCYAFLPVFEKTSYLLITVRMTTYFSLWFSSVFPNAHPLHLHCPIPGVIVILSVLVTQTPISFWSFINRYSLPGAC